MSNPDLNVTPEGETYHCVACKRPDSADDFVQCDECDSWWHQSCAGVTPSIKGRDWSCRNCSAISVTTHTTTSSARAKRLALQLEMLNEQRAIEQKAMELKLQADKLESDKQFIKQKYDILQADLLNSDDHVSQKSRISQRTNRRQVTQWIEQLPNEEEGAFGPLQKEQTAASQSEDAGIYDTEEKQQQQQLEQQQHQQLEQQQQQQLKQQQQQQLEQQQQQREQQVEELLNKLQQQQKKLRENRRQEELQEQQEFQRQQEMREQELRVQKLREQEQRAQKLREQKLRQQELWQYELRQQEQRKQQQKMRQEELRQLRQEQQIDKMQQQLQLLDQRLKGAVSKQYPKPPPPSGNLFGLEDFLPKGNSDCKKPPASGKSTHTEPRPFTTIPPASGEDEPLQSLIRQLGLGPTETINLPQCLSQFTPSPSQLAARQVMPRDLPPFSGNPADWPVFISNFTNTTLACGYSSAENLIRLQRCLKGPALDAVRSRLLLPESVPHIIETLRLLYGRPELLINALLEKVRSVPTPKADKLESLIDFGLSVQSLCDHLEAANQRAHLSNPSLLFELVEKLPVHVKMEWASYMDRNPEPNLKNFGEFMSQVVKSASRVTLYTGAASKGEDKSKPKRGSIHSHSDGTQPATSGDSSKPCPACNNHGHRLKECGTFRSYNIDGKWRFVQDHAVCRNCLNAHGRRPCRSSSRCGVNGCQFRHHPLLHSTRPMPSRLPNALAENHTHRQGNQSPFFRIIPVTLFGRDNAIDTFAFLDDGSSLTLVEEDLVKQLEVEGIPQPLCLKWTGSMSRVEKESKLVQLKVSGANQSPLSLRNARTVKALTLPKQSVNFKQLAEKYCHLKGLPVSSYQNAVPRILVGLDNLHLSVPQRIKEGQYDEPVGVKTRLGWCIYGGPNDGRSMQSLNYHACECTKDQVLHDVVRDYFALEDAGVKPVLDLEPREEKRARHILEQSTVRVGERFETGLLWRFDHFEFPDSFPMALKRLECLERRMQRNPTLKANLMQQMEEYQEKGYAHHAVEEELREADPKRVWYLPLGAVVNPKKPEKVRMVWDASAKVDGISLNTMLLKGPDQLTSLPTVLFRFRQFKIAVSGDIKEMFHQIRISKPDRHAQRFLWRIDPMHTPGIFIMDVATFGSTCSPASAQFVKNKNAMEFVDHCQRATEAIIKNHYVDDYLDSFKNQEEANKVVANVRTIHAKGGFEIRNWQSNSSTVLESLGQRIQSQPRSLNLESTESFERVLGLLWLPREDLLSFSAIVQPELQDLITSGRCPTKRQVLKCLMSFFDPLGLLAAFILHGKILLQDIWRSGIQWDDLLNDELYERWRRWTKLFPLINEVRISRCYFKDATSAHYNQLELHVFVDASEEAYSAVAYFRIVKPNREVECTLVAAKTKVAPLKPISVPRMELQAAVLGVRLMQFVIDGHNLPITRRLLWSDSRVTLAWIQTDSRRFKQYVNVRLGEIRTATNVTDWRWVPSMLNVADEATKWGKGPRFDVKGPWFRGPDFLKQPEERWPQPKEPIQSTDEEVRPCFAHRGIAVPETIVDLSRFSKWNRLLRAMGYVYRFINNSRCRKLRQQVDRDRPDYLTHEELNQAEYSLYRMVQWAEYPDELATLTMNQELVVEQRSPLEKSSALYQFTPILDEHGVLRLDGRVQAEKTASLDVKYPIILPRHGTLTYLIADYYHRKYRHANADTVVNEMRQRYLVPQLRVVVKRAVGRCQWCKVAKAKPQIPKMAPLPYARLASFVRPFSYVGLDLFGPLLVKVGRSNAKRWAALFTCLTIRAVHVEIVYSLKTEACVMAVRRFVSRRGSPAEIHSDNGTNFHGADRLLQEQIRKITGALAATFTNATTKWIFIPPAAPHMGGSWERMVRSVKTAMEAANAGRKQDDEGLLTLVIEAEGMVNSRPLTYLPLDSDEQEALTPNHFLLGSSNGVRQPVAEPTNETSALRSSWNMIQYQLDVFWRRWVREYLPTITRRTKWFGEVKPVVVGDLVFIVDQGKRNGWVRGRVVDTIPGRDGRVRKAIVQANGGLIHRPVARLAVLDVAQTGKTELGASAGQCYRGEDVGN